MVIEVVVDVLVYLVSSQRLAVFAHVAAGRALLVPVESAVVKVLGLGFPTHPALPIPQQSMQQSITLQTRPNLTELDKKIHPTSS